MSKYFVEGQDLTDIADAIREGLATTESLEFPDDFISKIGDLGGGGITPTGTINITQNGTTDVTQYASANVAVPNSYAAADEGKVVSNGALVAQTSKNISSNGTVDTTLNNQVVVAVPNSYSASDEGKVVSGGALVAQGSDTVTTNDTYDTTLINSLIVNVSGGGSALADTYKSIIERTISGRLVDSNLTKLGQRAFEACTGLTSVFFSGVTQGYGSTCFYLCTNLLTAVFTNTSETAASLMSNCTKLTAFDTNATKIAGNTFTKCTVLTTIVLRRSDAIVPLAHTNAFTDSPYKSGGTGGTIYIPKALYDHLGDGTSLDYKAATNWSTVNGYGTITWAKIEGSAYENAYVDGTPIT